MRRQQAFENNLPILFDATYVLNQFKKNWEIFLAFSEYLNFSRENK